MPRVRLTNQSRRKPSDDPGVSDVINLPATAGGRSDGEGRTGQHEPHRARGNRAGGETPASGGAAAAAAKAREGRGLTERQWTVSLLVVAGLMTLFTFRGCVLPSGVGPKSQPAAQLTATPAPAATTAPAGQEYTVKGGDTLSSIAVQYNTTVDALLQANNISRGTPLRVGQKLALPAGNAQTQPPPAP